MGYLFALISVVVWGINIILAKYFAATIFPFQITFGRWAVAALVLLPFTLPELWRKRRLIWQHIRYITVIALLGFVFLNPLLYKAAETTQPINVGLLRIVFPMFLMLLGIIFLKEKLTFRQAGGVIVAVFGVLMVLLRGDLTQLGLIKWHIGDFYTLINAMCFALYSFYQRKRPQDISQAGLLNASILVALLFLFPITYFTEGMPKLDKTSIELFLYLGIINSVIAFLCWNLAIAKLGPTKAGMFYYLMPLVTAVGAWFVFDEKIVMFEILGGIFIIIGVLLLTITTKKATPSNNNHID